MTAIDAATGLLLREAAYSAPTPYCLMNGAAALMPRAITAATPELTACCQVAALVVHRSSGPLARICVPNATANTSPTVQVMRLSPSMLSPLNP